MNKILLYRDFIAHLEKASLSETESLLWQPAGSKINYLPLHVKLVYQIKESLEAGDKLILHNIFEGTAADMLIFYKPGSSDLPYSPLLMDAQTQKAIGIIMPFNDLHDIYPAEDEGIFQLTSRWILFTMEKRFGMKIDI